MNPGFDPRQVLLWSTLTLSVLATIWTSLAEDEAQDIAVAAVRSPVPVSSPMPISSQMPGDEQAAAGPRLNPANSRDSLQLAALDTRQLQRPRWEENADDQGQLHDPFQGSKQAEAEAAPEHTAQQVMEIPTLPFSYAGKLMDNGQYTVFLSAGEQNYSVKRGDVVQGWQVKSISPPTMIMRYQAMQMDVPLMIGEQN